MSKVEQLDIFLSYNKKDRDNAILLYEHLTSRKLNIWLDEPKIAAGFPWIEGVAQAIRKTVCAAILVGKSGLGDWQKSEVIWCIDESKRRTLAVVPVLFHGAPEPDLPPYLRVNAGVDLREGVTQAGIDLLVASVAGLKAADTSREILVVRAESQSAQQPPVPFVDAWGIASVKSRLHALSEIIAQAAVQVSAQSAETLHDELLSILLPITVEMRWYRGYAAALERMLKIPSPKKWIRDFAHEEVPGGPATSEGVLSARLEEDGRVLVLLDGHPALFVTGIGAEECEPVVESVELHGRLGLASRGGMTLAERIGEIPVRLGAATVDPLANALFQNREILAPLVARTEKTKKTPLSDWLLAEDEDYGNVPRGQEPAWAPKKDWRSALMQSQGEIKDEVFEAKHAWRGTRAQIAEILRTFRH